MVFRDFLGSNLGFKGVAHDVEVLVFRQGVVKIQFWGTLGIFGPCPTKTK